MVHGIERFKEYLGKYTKQYIFIGGTACDIILGRLGENFRQTKDLDMVLLIEELDEEFMEQFIYFIEEGKYQHINKGTGENQFYRFEKPTDTSFPYMIELFSRRPDYLINFDSRLSPIHVSDDVVSLSAILLDDEYYALLSEGVAVVEEISVLDLEHLILFKIKAWLDLSARKNRGEHVDSKNIKKHKNDVLRLAAYIEKDATVLTTGQVREDVEQFISVAEKDDFDLSTLGIREVTYRELLDTIKHCYLSSMQK